MSWEQQVQALYIKHFELVYRFFYFKFLSKELAEDLTSETFLSLAQDLRADKVINDVDKYLYGIARNIFITALKRKYREQISIPLEEDFMQEVTEYVSSFKHEPLEDKLLRLLPQLPVSQQTVIRLRLIDKLSLSEIVAKLGKNMNYVKVNQKRAIKSLRRLLCTRQVT